MPHRPTPEPPELSRALGPLAASALLAGTVVGTGIFLVPSTIAREVQSVSLAFLVWMVGAMLSLAGALTYAELGAALPLAGGEYAFLRRAYGPVWGFLYGWQQVVIGKTGSIAGIAVAFALFLGYFLGGLERDVLHFESPLGLWRVTGLQLAALGAVFLLTAVNAAGVALGGALQSFLTALKVGAVLGLAALALGSGRGSWAHFETAPAPSARGLEFLSHFGAALAAALWAYDGWNAVTLVGAEIRDPQRTIPRVLILGILAVAAIYMLINLACFYVLPFDRVQRSERVAQEVAELVLGRFGGTALTLAALVSTLATLNGSILTGARIFYAMARDGLFFRRVAALHPLSRAPATALLLQGTLAALLILLFGRDQAAFERLFDYALFGTWGFYGITVLAVVVLRYRHPELPRPYLTLGYPWIPLCFALVATLFCFSIALRRPWETGFGLVLLAAGLPFYGYWRWAQRGETRVKG
ncbi:APC family permease [Candidatus Methylocalor cossyra]|uniref:Basic amino acid/polyamine antiporter, APA family n=1 Tax=Candidatus Methylocalor cossyra TaxID=3108543 RepID=A0ABM9NG46_9GAMM